MNMQRTHQIWSTETHYNYLRFQWRDRSLQISIIYVLLCFKDELKSDECHEKTWGPVNNDRSWFFFRFKTVKVKKYLLEQYRKCKTFYFYLCSAIWIGDITKQKQNNNPSKNNRVLISDIYLLNITTSSKSWIRQAWYWLQTSMKLILYNYKQVNIE